jgi:hypothetical protein
VTKEIPQKTLLLPKGKREEFRNVYYFDTADEEPLFQKFANLKTTEEIRAFAGEYGCLRKEPECWVDKKGNRIVLLESVVAWGKEICALNVVLQAIVIWKEGRISSFKFEFNKETGQVHIFPPLKSEMTIGSDRMYAETYLTAPYVEGAPEETIFKMAVTRLIDEKLRENPSTPIYLFGEKGQIKPYLHPQSLAAAIWLQLAQSFFKDGPAERIAERCYLCGKWGKAYKEWFDTITLDTEIWGQRKKGPEAGLYYHKRCDKAKRMRELREQRAEEEGRELKKRKRTKKLLTEQTITT